MKIQSLSIDVPCKSGKCVNGCPFCCSRMHTQKYNPLMLNNDTLAYGEKMFKRRLEFTKDEGCNNVILTGEIEPMQNLNFLRTFGHINWTLKNPFHWIEIQTTGFNCNESTLIVLQDAVGVSTISLSIVDPFDSELNHMTMGLPDNTMNLFGLCSLIKTLGFNLRISLNLTQLIDKYTPAQIFTQLKDELGADQVTFRKLYKGRASCPENDWIDEYGMSKGDYDDIVTYIKSNGRRLERLPFGATKYACKGLTTVVDDDCMSEADDKEELKYLILRPDCKLYTKWDLKESLLF